MMQGDSYYLGIRVLNNAGYPVTPKDVSDVEISIGHLIKNYHSAELLYSDGYWLYPLSQEETFEFWPEKEVKSRIRVFWPNGVVEGKPIYGIRFAESISKEVL